MRFADYKGRTVLREVTMKNVVLFILLSVASVCLMAVQPAGLSADQGPAMFRDGEAPFNLMAQQININDVLLVWENPVYTNQPMGFRIYCNNNMVRYIPGDEVTDCVLCNVCEGGHQFYVTAYYDTGCESDPSNIAELTVTLGEDYFDLIRSVAVSIYPCPARHVLNVSLQGGKDNLVAEAGIYDIRGRLMQNLTLRSGSTATWNCLDKNGKPAPAGMYFLRVATENGSIVRKFSVLK